MLNARYFLAYSLLMTAVVVASNFLVQFPLQGTLAGINLADLLTFGAFTYPIAFLVTDLTNRTYFFELTTSPSVIWVRMAGLDLTAGAPTLVLDPYDETLTGDVTDRFAARDIPF